MEYDITHLADREPLRPCLLVEVGLGRHNGEDCVTAGRHLIHVRPGHDSPSGQVDIMHACMRAGR